MIHRRGKLLEVVRTTLMSFTEYVRQLIVEEIGEQARLDAKLVSVSLMVLSGDGKQLVIVAGNTTDPSFTLNIGDGNAGSAWKRRVARVYDKSVADSKINVFPEQESTSP